MSLLLDALKKAAQEKLDRQGRQAQSRAGTGEPEPTQFDPGQTAHTGLSDESAPIESTDVAGAGSSDTVQPTEVGEYTMSPVDSGIARHDDTAHARNTEATQRGGTELELEPADRDHFELRLDTTGFEKDSTLTGSVDEPGSGLTTDELDAYLAGGARTTQRPARDDTHFGAVAGEQTDPTYRQSLTENFRMESAKAGYQSAGTPEQAAQLFSIKSRSDNRSRLYTLIGLAAVAALVLAGLFGYEYVAEIDQGELMYAGPRPSAKNTLEPMRAPAAARPVPKEDVDPALLIEQEDYSGLFQDTLAEYEAESEQTPTADPVVPTERRSEADRAETARRTQPAAKRSTTAGRSGEFSIQRGRPGGGEPLRGILMRGWEAYNRGELDTAAVAYRQALSRSPRSRDALLGLAAVHQVRGESVEARQYYRRVLELDPRDDFALAGLTSLAGADRGGQNAANDTAREMSRIKTLLSERPEAPHLHFTLGNLFAARQRWADAQQAYFDAYRLSDNNPDYAFNLAVSLEHLGQQEAAVRFYREALRTSKTRRANFQPAALQSRINSLTDTHAASQTQQ